MLSGALPTLTSLALTTGSLPPSSESLNCDIISLLATQALLEQAGMSDKEVSANANADKRSPHTDGENSHNSINGDTHDTLSGLEIASDYLNTNIDRSLLTKSYNFRARSPIPADERLVRSSGDKIF